MLKIREKKASDRIGIFFIAGLTSEYQVKQNRPIAIIEFIKYMRLIIKIRINPFIISFLQML